MVDFRQLIHQTPQERAAAIAEIGARFERKQTELLQRRLDQLAAAEALAGLSDRDRTFLGSLRRLANDYDAVGGRPGGRLLYISGPQANWLEDLDRRATQRQVLPATASGSGAATMFERLGHLTSRRSERRPDPTSPDESAPRPRG